MSVGYIPIHDYSEDYFTMVITTGGDVTWTGTSSNALSYSIDNGTTWSTASSSITLSVNESDKILWSGITAPHPQQYQGIGKFGGDDNVRYSVEGNVMSLLYGDDFKGQTSLVGKDYALKELFYGNKNIISAENLSLPATTLARDCYTSMFYGCTSLTTAPELSIEGKNYVFYELFKSNTNITSAENLSLPATTLAQSCYTSMFSGCTSLTTAPELLATTLARGCYDSMFSGCTSLTTAPELLATTLAQSCYTSMFSGCTSLTTAPELPAATLTNYCYNSMFNGCTSLTTAPELSATTLTECCYDSMFNNCTSLTTAPELSATTLGYRCCRNMFKGCTSLTIAPELPATTLKSECYDCMFYGCTSLTTAPELPATTLSSNCYNLMFAGCTSLTTAPELPATTLTTKCYNSMFSGCTSLSSIKCLATNISYRSNYTTNWVYNVAPNGTFTKASAATWRTGSDGIPDGWTVVDAA